MKISKHRSFSFSLWFSVENVAISTGEKTLKTTVSAKMDIHIWKLSRLFKPRLATDCAQETLLYPASASWCVFEMPVCFTSKSNPRDHWNNISHGRSPDLSPFSDCLPNRWAVSDTDCVRKVAMELTVAGLFRIHTWFPFNRQRPVMPSSNQCDRKIKKFSSFRKIFQK